MVVIRLRNLFSRLVLVVLVVLFCNSGTFVWGLNYTKYRQVGDLRLARIQKHLDTLNKPPVFSIQSPDGDIIDCVHKRKQPALDHPLLKNHKIQRVPAEMPKVKSMGKQDQEESVSEKSANISKNEGYIRIGAWQMWHKNGERCPKGTVPVRRSTVHDVLRADSLYDFGKKRSNVPLARRADAPDVVSGNGHEIEDFVYTYIYNSHRRNNKRRGEETMGKPGRYHTVLSEITSEKVMTGLWISSERMSCRRSLSCRKSPRSHRRGCRRP